MFLQGKRVLITGGGRRVGAELTRRFAAAGATVLIHCRRFSEEAEALAASLPGSGHKVFSADLALPGAAEALVEQTGPFELLVNNASTYSPPLLVPGSQDETSMRVNCLVPVRLVELLAEFGFPESAAVNVIDQAVLQKECPHDAYHDARKKLAKETERLALRYASRGLRVNAVAPGPMLPPAWIPGSQMTRTLKSVPLGRRVEVRDLADSVLFLMRNDSITGAILPVDCGQHIFVNEPQ